MILSNLALLSGGLMLLGYLFYITQTLRREIEPNPLTWLMFAYGTGLLTFLEWDRGAGFDLLLLPVTCTLCGVFVAFICWRRGKITWPKDWEDGASFTIDLLCTIGYLAAWAALVFGQITPEWRETANWVFLILSNVSAIPAFIPILRSTVKNPSVERAAPWLIWTSSYMVLGVVTYQLEGLGTLLILYPALNTLLHGTMAYLSLPHRRKRHQHRQYQEMFG